MVQASLLTTETQQMTTIFFQPEISDELKTLIFSMGEKMTIKKGDCLPKQIILNYFVYVREGLIFYNRRTNNYSKPKFSSVILPDRVTDYHLVIEDSCTCCKTIIAARDCQLIVLNKAIINNLINTDPHLYSRIMHSAVHHTERQMALTMFLLISSAEDKLIKFLFDFLVSLHADFSQTWLALTIKLTREEIANILHISVIKLDLMIGALKKRGLIKKENGLLCINKAIFAELSACPLGREDANGCQSNNMDRFKSKNMISSICYF